MCWDDAKIDLNSDLQRSGVHEQVLLRDVHLAAECKSMYQKIQVTDPDM